MEAYSSLVWTYGAVHLDPVSSVDPDFTLVVEPWHPEDDDALRLYDSFKYLLVHQVWMLDDIWGYTLENFLYCLVEFLFFRVSGDEFRHESVNVILCVLVHDLLICFAKSEIKKCLREKARKHKNS